MSFVFCKKCKSHLGYHVGAREHYVSATQCKYCLEEKENMANVVCQDCASIAGSIPGDKNMFCHKVDCPICTPKPNPDCQVCKGSGRDGVYPGGDCDCKQSNIQNITITNDSDRVVWVNPNVIAEGQKITNEQGASQSFLLADFSCIPAKVLRILAQCLGFGKLKYGYENWKGIPISDNLSHAMNHINEWRRGDRSEPHLVNAMARITFALWQAIDSGEQSADYTHTDMEKVLAEKFAPKKSFEDLKSEDFKILQDCYDGPIVTKTKPKHNYEYKIPIDKWYKLGPSDTMQDGDMFCCYDNYQFTKIAAQMEGDSVGVNIVLRQIS